MGAGPAVDSRDPKRAFVPRRVSAKESPKDLGIENFKYAHGRQGLFVVDHAPEVAGARLYGLIVNADHGSLVFFIDENVPESLLVSSDASVLQRACAGREVIRVL
jgi:hypothetical protein